MQFQPQIVIALCLLLAGCIPPPERAPAHPAAASRSAPLVAHRIAAPMAGAATDPGWAQARPLRVPLAWGSHSSEHALDVELAALHTSDTLYLRARWPAAAPTGAADTTTARLTIHWRIPPAANAPPPACDVACHTVHTDGAGRLAYVHTETIPPGGSPGLSATGGWQDGAWVVVWSRPLVSPNPYDLQLTDLARAYPFFVKVFLAETDRPDAVSDLCELGFGP